MYHLPKSWVSDPHSLRTLPLWGTQWTENAGLAKMYMYVFKVNNDDQSVIETPVLIRKQDRKEKAYILSIHLIFSLQKAKIFLKFTYNKLKKHGVAPTPLPTFL